MKHLKLSLIIALIFTLTAGITVLATYDKLESSRAKDKANYATLQDTQFKLRQLGNEIAEMESLEREDLKTYCLGVQSTAIIALEQDNPVTLEQKEKWEKLKVRSCENYTINTLKDIYTRPSDLNYIFLKSEGAYETQSYKEHFARNGYMATDIATSGRKLNSYASFIKEKGKDEERTYEVKIVKNYDTMGLTIELHWEEDGVKYNWALGHMNKVYKKDGDLVKTGDLIGLSGGCVGELQLNEKSTGCHTHIEFRVEGVAVPYPTFAYTKHYGEDKKPVVSEIKEDLGDGWKITTYYSVQEGQKKYFNGGYRGDKMMNCGEGDCLVTSSGYQLKPEDAGKIIACPKEYAFGTIFEIDGKQMRCEDRGGAIKNKHLDLWVGIGDDGYSKVGQGSSKNAHVKIIK